MSVTPDNKPTTTTTTTISTTSIPGQQAPILTDISVSKYPRITAVKTFRFSSASVLWLLTDIEGSEIATIIITVGWILATYIGSPIFNMLPTYNALLPEITANQLAAGWGSILIIQLFAFITGHAIWKRVATSLIFSIHGIIAVIIFSDIGYSLLAVYSLGLAIGGLWNSYRLKLIAVVRQLAKGLR